MDSLLAHGHRRPLAYRVLGWSGTELVLAVEVDSVDRKGAQYCSVPRQRAAEGNDLSQHLTRRLMTPKSRLHSPKSYDDEDESSNAIVHAELQVSCADCFAPLAAVLQPGACPGYRWHLEARDPQTPGRHLQVPPAVLGAYTNHNRLRKRNVFWHTPEGKPAVLYARLDSSRGSCRRHDGTPRRCGVWHRIFGEADDVMSEMSVR